MYVSYVQEKENLNTTKNPRSCNKEKETTTYIYGLTDPDRLERQLFNGTVNVLLGSMHRAKKIYLFIYLIKRFRLLISQQTIFNDFSLNVIKLIAFYTIRIRTCIFQFARHGNDRAVLAAIIRVMISISSKTLMPSRHRRKPILSKLECFYRRLIGLGLV